MATTTPKVLTETYGATDKDVEFRAILKAGNEKYRVSIRRNSYGFQSHARVDLLLLAAGWVQLIDLHHGEFADDLHAPIAGDKVNAAARKTQMRELAANLVIDAHRAYTA